MGKALRRNKFQDNDVGENKESKGHTLKRKIEKDRDVVKKVSYDNFRISPPLETSKVSWHIW
jgi:hypothetical protein